MKIIIKNIESNLKEKVICNNFKTYTEEEMKKNIRILLFKFINIRNKGYIKTVRKGSTGVGATFEYYIGKKEDSLEIPDFRGIEIKVRRAYSKSKISLFNAAPKGNCDFESKRLLEKYGYPKKDDKKLKRLYALADCKNLTKVGLKYYFELFVDYQREELRLNVYNNRKELIDSSTYWPLEQLRNKIERKLTFLAVVKAWRSFKEEIEYFKYFEIEFYKLKSSEKFIELINSGKIKVIFKIDSYSDVENYGKISSHGVAFTIAEEDLMELYYLYNVKNDFFI